MSGLGLAPADGFWTRHQTGGVRLRMGDSGAAARPPITVPQLFTQAVREFGHREALCVQREERWERMTYLQYEEQCRALARGLLQMGLERSRGVLILGQNSLEWFIGLIGAIMAGGVAVGVDPWCSAASCLEVALASQAQVILLQGDQQLQKILKVQEKLPGLKAIVRWDGPLEEGTPLVHTWRQLISLGSQVEEARLDDVISSQRANQCCAVMYEDGMAAAPRGVLLSHDNVTWTCWRVAGAMGLGSQEVVLSYLPLNLMSVQMCDLWIPLICGGATYFPQPGNHKSSLLAALRAVRPTLFLSRPQFWEAVQRSWSSAHRKAHPLRKMILGWARGRGLTAYNTSGALPWGYSLAGHLIFRPARRALGLDRCRCCYVTMATMDPELVEYYGGLGVELLELHGTNESSGVQHLRLPGTRPRGSGSLEALSCPRHEGPETAAHQYGRHICMGRLAQLPDTMLQDGRLLTQEEEELHCRPITDQHE
ncbi:long-chain-fatty-acid--CoA ligase ACSBG2-like, partial [Gastrophryne carolinensis]